jgi:hypothetical protein
MKSEIKSVANDREYVIYLHSFYKFYIEDAVYEYSKQVMSDDVSELFFELGYYLQFEDTEEGMEITGLGDASASAIFGIVINAVIDKIIEEKIEYLFLTAEEPSRQKLYARLVPIIAKKMGWKGQANNGKCYFLSKNNLINEQKETNNILLDKMIKDLSDDERKFIKYFGDEVRLRKFMTTEEIKMANKLFKKGLMEKGKSDEKNPSVTYYVDSSIYRRL